MAYTILIVSARLIQGNTDEHQIKNCVFNQGMILIKICMYKNNHVKAKVLVLFCCKQLLSRVVFAAFYQ